MSERNDDPNGTVKDTEIELHTIGEGLQMEDDSGKNPLLYDKKPPTFSIAKKVCCWMSVVLIVEIHNIGCKLVLFCWVTLLLVA